jgi:type II secretory pathway component GspD/PulD (secretin)
MTNMMRGMTAMMLLTVGTPAAGQGTTQTVAVPMARDSTKDITFRIGRYLDGDPAVNRDTIVVRTFPLRYLGSAEAAKLVGPYVFRSAQSAVFDGGSRANAITVRERPEVLAVIDSVLREFDRPPNSLVLRFQLLSSSDSPTTDPNILDVDQALRGLFRFPGYRVVAEGTTIVGESEGFMVTMSGESDRYITTGTIGRVTPGTSPNVKLNVDLKAAPRSPAPADSIPRAGMMFDMMMGSQVVASGVTMPVGEAVVLGSGSITEQKGTLILVVRSTLRPPLPR